MNSIPLILIGLNIYFSFKGFNNKFFFNRYKFNPSYIKKGELIRFISSGFLHVNTTHLLVNMLTLFFYRFSNNKAWYCKFSYNLFCQLIFW